MGRILIGLVLAGTITASAPAAPRSNLAISAEVQRQATARELSGTVLVQRDGTKPFIKSFGIAERAFSVPATPRTRYRVASITKLFTSTMVMMLVDEGKLGLDEPVGRYLPSLKGEARSVGIRQLLNHTSGIAQYDRVSSLDQALQEGVPNYQRPLSAEAMLKLCCEGPLVARPGARFDYNNADYLLLGSVIEAIDKRPFEESLSARLLRPLGLSDSGVARQSTLIARLAPTYYFRPDTRTWMNDLPVYFENWDAAGAMYSTPQDVARFAESLFAGKLLTPGSLKQLLSPGLDDYGFGLWSYEFKRGGRTYRVAKRPGSIMGANAVLYRLVDQRITIAVLANTNRVDLDEFAQRIAEWIVDHPSASISS